MNPLFRGNATTRARPLLATIREVADAHGATPAQVALAWLIDHPKVVAIPGARTIAQLEENAAAADLRLTGEEMARLTREAERFDAGNRL